MNNSIQEVINLVKKTGDNCIVVDSNGKPEFVIMSFDSYRKMIENNPKLMELSEEELLQKINRDIAVWKSNPQNDNLGLDSSIFLAKESQNIGITEDFFENEEEQRYYFEPIE